MRRAQSASAGWGEALGWGLVRVDLGHEAHQPLELVVELEHVALAADHGPSYAVELERDDEDRAAVLGAVRLRHTHLCGYGGGGEEGW